ncbi:MAG: purine-nucleoside phosphorylase, partial [Wenyingzhuangia sp.]
MTLANLQESINFIKKTGVPEPSIGIVLGTGLGKLVDDIQDQIVFNYEDLPHFVTSTLESHAGKLIFGTLGGKTVVVMSGRFHLYEGYSFNEITYGIRVLKGLGVQKLLISNAAGAINLDFNKGELMLIEDHINLQGGSPLAFKN